MSVKKSENEFKKFPDYTNLHGEFAHELDEWKKDSVKKLEKAKRMLNDILDSELMKQAVRFAGKHVRDRWEGQLSVVTVILEALK